MQTRRTREDVASLDCTHEPIPGRSLCGNCDAIFVVRRLFRGHPKFKALEDQFVSQINAGRYSMHSLKARGANRRAIEYLIAYGKKPNAAWVDALAVPARTRETFRGELFVAGLLPTSARLEDTTEKLVVGRCEHSTTGCLVCRAKRRIEACLRPYVHLHALRDYYFRQLDECGYEPHFFRGTGNKLFTLLSELGRHEGNLSHAWLDTRHTNLHEHIRALRRDLVACGLLEKRADSAVVCTHAHIGRRVEVTCTFCSAKRTIFKMFDDHAELAALRTRLLDQIDRGLYNRHVVQRSGQVGRFIRALCERTEPISHAWLDNLDVRRCDREQFRTDLIAVGLLAAHDVVVIRSSLLPRSTSVGCAHRTTSCCRTCSVERMLVAAFYNFPILHPLRDRYIAQYKDGFYPKNYFHRPANKIWRYIDELGKSGQMPTHRDLDSRPSTAALRALREELIACGLIERIAEHPEVRRFQLWADRVIAEAQLDENARMIVERYRKLRMMAYARQHLNRRSDHGHSVRNRLHGDLRRIIRFIQHLESLKRTLCDFTKADMQTLSDKTLASLRPFLIWLRYNELSTERWIPKSVASNAVYRGIGLAALRKNTKRLLDDSTVPLRFRVLAILSYFGFSLTALSSLRASAATSTDSIFIGRRKYELEPSVASMVNQLRNELTLEAEHTRPQGWDPWLFAPADAIEEPDSMPLSRQLLRYGFKSRGLRNESKRMGAANATVCLVTQRALGRGTNTSASHLKAFSARAGSYAAMLATERFLPEHEI